MQDEDGEKGTAQRAAELCGIAYIQMIHRSRELVKRTKFIPYYAFMSDVKIACAFKEEVIFDLRDFGCVSKGKNSSFERIFRQFKAIFRRHSGAESKKINAGMA